MKIAQLSILAFAASAHSDAGAVLFDSSGQVEALSLPGKNYTQITPDQFAVTILDDQGRVEGANFLDKSVLYQSLIRTTGNFGVPASVSAIDVDGRIHRDNTLGCGDLFCTEFGQYEIYSDHRYVDAVVVEAVDFSGGAAEYRQWLIGLTDTGSVVEVKKLPFSLCTPTLPKGNGYTGIHAAFNGTSLALVAIDQDGFILTESCTGENEDQSDFLSPPAFSGFSQAFAIGGRGNGGFVGVAIHESGEVYMWGGDVGQPIQVASGMRSISVRDDFYASGIREDGTPDWNLEGNSSYPEDIQVIEILGEGIALVEYEATVFNANPSNLQQVYDNCANFDTINLTTGDYDLSSLSIGDYPKSLKIDGTGPECRIQLKGTGFSEYVGQFLISNSTIVLDCASNSIEAWSQLKFKGCNFELSGPDSCAQQDYIFGSESNWQGQYSFEDCEFQEVYLQPVAATLVANASRAEFKDCDLSLVKLNYLSPTSSFGGWTSPRYFFINNCTFSGRSISGSFESSLSLFGDQTVNIDLTGTVFSGNESVRGGAICVSPSNPDESSNSRRINIRNGLFINNSAQYGGAIYSAHKSLNIHGSQFIENSSENGGSLYITGEIGFSADISNCDFVPNNLSLSEIGSFRVDTEVSNSLFSGEPLGGYTSIWQANKAVFISSANIFCGNINDFAGLTVIDSGGNVFEDNCDQIDCNSNGQIDIDEIESGSAVDCDFNGILDSCEMSSDPSLDCDGSGTLDSCDIENGTLDDCNQNQIGDACEIAANPGLDSNSDGIIDSCQCITDINLDGVTDFTDIVQLLSCWQDDADGVCTFADVNKDEAIDFGDLILVLSGFGPC